MKRVLLLIPSVLKREVEAAVREDRHPRMDYAALADGLRAVGVHVDLVGYAELEAERHPLVRLARRGGRDAALATVGYVRRGSYDAIFTNGENIAIPLAMLFKTGRRKTGHVSIGHKPSTEKKRIFFQRLHAHRQIDTLFVYAKTQHEFARTNLKIPERRLRLFHFHADERFYRPLPTIAVDPDTICSAGLEWRDYPTLIDALRDQPEIRLFLAAASPWSKHTDETANRELPAHVDARRYEYNELRELYARSAIVAVPLYENDFQAGITTMLEAMAMGKALIVTATSGQRDVVTDGENGLTVAPGDAAGWQAAIARLRSDAALRERLGNAARRWIEENASLDRWVSDIISALRDASNPANVESQGKPQGIL